MSLHPNSRHRSDLRRIFFVRVPSLLGLLVATSLLPLPAVAHGAFTMGVYYPSGGGWSYSYGWGADYDTAQEAEQRAMNECKLPPRGTDASRAACKVLSTFSRQCVSLAIDDGNGAYGWSVRDELITAQEMSILNCVKYGGRRDACAIHLFGCDKSP